MKILFVVDEYPFPPRNGVTVPIASFIERFAAANVQVDLLWFDLEPTVEEPLPQGPVGELIRVPMERSGPVVAAVAAECLGVAPVFSAWRPIRRPRAITVRQYDLVWASPIRAFGLWLKHRDALGLGADRTWAVINDSYTLTLHELARRQGSRASRILYWARALGMRRVEPRLLAHADLVAVQSSREVEFFRDAFGNLAGPRLIELKNGVSDALFATRGELRRDLLFVGTLDAFYKPTLEWFIQEVYSKLPEPRPSFSVIGKGATNEDRQIFDGLSIEYLPFVEDIAGVYLSSRILVAPIFKGYGTINKVIEGMAAGCVVIGDPTAFNGIRGFVPGRDGIVATGADEFVTAICATLADQAAAVRIGDSARELMRRDFSWNSRVETVLEELKAG